MSKKYIKFESQQNQYIDADKESFFPPTLVSSNCFSRHILINKFLSTKKACYLFWAIERDTNVLMDPFVVETITYWTNLINESQNDKNLFNNLNNVGKSLINTRNNSNFFHYDTGFVHSYNGETELITFEVHPPRRCFRIIDNFNYIFNFLDDVLHSKKNAENLVKEKFQIDNFDLNPTDLKMTTANIISHLHNNIKKIDSGNLKLSANIALNIYDQAKEFTNNLNYIVDTFRTVDYWDPDKKR